LAEESIHIEQNCIMETVGSQDQVLAAYGGLNHITFSSDDAIGVKPLTIPLRRIAELNSHLMLFYTGIKRTASDIAQSYVQAIECKRKQLRGMQGLVDEGISVLSSRGDIRSFGELLNDAWTLKRSLSCLVSNPEVDELYNRARAAGAIGGKLTGAGGGGFLLLFVPPEAQVNVRRAFDHLIHVPFEFESFGSQILFVHRQEDFSPVSRIRASQSVGAFKELRVNG
jgi:D-glycero-alpha-D-manno-heptose-7-phosphate kinase